MLAADAVPTPNGATRVQAWRDFYSVKEQCSMLVFLKGREWTSKNRRSIKLLLDIGVYPVRVFVQTHAECSLLHCPDADVSSFDFLSLTDSVNDCLQIWIKHFHCIMHNEI